MSQIPVISGKRLIKALAKIGYYVRDQRGSHIHLRHPYKNPLTIPNHKEIAKGTLRAILRVADIPVEELLELL
ncbi:MAG: type II toxin-antitoxin system HicA family toxin [Candidatus Thermoplasmatota archaeon]|jgi:predicted RNA binding protein YcfA (HicA-like mRNA interferase family)|nr:type II toxin-antitoxin system HicA family toxin [Candidatus Thermoplasmatota archaeon]